MKIGSTLQSPIQKFRWVHFPLDTNVVGTFNYRVTPMFMDASDKLSGGVAIANVQLNDGRKLSATNDCYKPVGNLPKQREIVSAKFMRIVTPALSRAWSTLSTKVPATARLPSSVDANRTPSSSANPITSTANGNRRPRLCKSATQEIAVIRPSGPSHLPASRTVS